MSRLLHEFGIADLSRFEDLAADRAICLAYQERSTTGFARVLHHAADTDRTVQLSTFLVAQVRVLECLEHAFLLGHKHTRKDLFVTDGVFFETIGHDVIDILDENDVGILLIEVLNERAVSTRAEEEFAVLGTERRAVRISRQRVGTRQLLGEGDVVLDIVFVFELLEVVRDMLTEQRQMVMADGEMQINGRFLAFAFAVLRTFYQMLQRGRTRAVAIFME